MHRGLLEFCVELVGVDVDAVAVLLLAETHDQRHHMDPQGLRIRQRDVRGAVRDEVDHSSESTYG